MDRYHIEANPDLPSPGVGHPDREGKDQRDWGVDPEPLGRRRPDGARAGRIGGGVPPIGAEAPPIRGERSADRGDTPRGRGNGLPLGGSPRSTRAQAAANGGNPRALRGKAPPQPPASSTIPTPLDVPSRVAPAAIIARAVAASRMPPEALTPDSPARQPAASSGDVGGRRPPFGEAGRGLHEVGAGVRPPGGRRGSSPRRSAGRSRGSP